MRYVMRFNEDNLLVALRELKSEVARMNALLKLDVQVDVTVRYLQERLLELRRSKDVFTVHQRPAVAGECWIDLEPNDRVVQLTAAFRTLNRNLGKFVAHLGQERA